MSNTGNASPLPPAPPRRNGVLTVFMVLAGIIMLLPGLCAVVFGVASINDSMLRNFLPLIVVCLLIGFGGIMLLRAAYRGR